MVKFNANPVTPTKCNNKYTSLSVYFIVCDREGSTDVKVRIVFISRNIDTAKLTTA